MNYDLVSTLTFGITFGIVLMTIVYTFIRYIYSKEIFYISYSLMQIFSLIFIVSYSKLFDISFFIQEVALILGSLASIIFAVNFYEGKYIPKLTNYKELIVNTLLLNIVILTAFYHYMLFEYLPYTIIYAILFLSIIFNLKQEFKPTIVYVIGWSVICLLLFVFDFKSYYEQEGFVDIVVVAFAIEALLFTISVSYRYSILSNQTKDYEKMLLQKSKLAQSGEMIENITHQFRQPLNNLSYILMNLKKRYENSKLDEVYFDKKVLQANSQIEFLSKTIDDFKEFYTPSKDKEEFEVIEAIQNATTVISAELKKYNIDLDIDFKINENIKIIGIKSELSQVILALISNAKDELKSTQNPYIKIDVSSNNAEVIIKVYDNAGGIKKKDLNKVFEPYYTTKIDGSGIGLYLVKQIVEDSFDGKIELENKKEGACFTLFFEKTT